MHIEQTSEYSPLYLIKEDKDLVSRIINPSEVSFASPVRVKVTLNPEKVQVINYKRDLLYEKVWESPKTYLKEADHYFFLQAFSYEDQLGFAWLKSEQASTLEETTSTLLENNVELPASLLGFSYDTSFSYPKEIIDLLKEATASYIDRYKRPLNMALFENGFYLPGALDKSRYTFKDLALNPTAFPITISLKDLPVAVFDLEPGYTEEDLSIIQNLPAIYEETTPKGGKHILVYHADDTFKYRLSDHLEVLTSALVTFYGNSNITKATFYGLDQEKLDATILENAKSLKTNNYQLERTKASKDPAPLIEEFRNLVKRDQLLTEQKVLKQLEVDKDESHAEYMALLYLYGDLLEPNKEAILKRGYKEEDLPFILHDYALELFPYRLKHDHTIKGVPYLLYQANHVISYKNKKG